MAVQNVRVNILVDDAELKAAKKDVKAIAKELGVAEDQVEGVAQAMAESRAETKRFDESVKKMSKSLGISEKEARKLARETEKAKRESEKLAAGGKKVEKSFGGIGKAAKAAGVAILAAVSLRGIVNLAESAVNLAAAMEQNRVAFKTFLGSAKAADKLLGQIEKKAASTPFQFPELVESSKKLLAFNVEADKIIPTLSSIGDIAAGTGNSVSELAELYGKAKVQGRLFAEDVNQLTGRGIPIIQEFAKQFGVADSEVKKLVESGKIGFPALEKAFQNLTSEGGKFFGLTEAQSETTAGKISTLKDNFEKLLRTLGEKLLPTVNAIVDGLLSLVGAEEDLSDAQEEVAQTGLDVVESTTKEIRAGEALLKRYDDLQSKTNLTGREKLELKRVTDELVTTFGASVVSINQETGALEVNRREVLNQIATRAALRSEAAQGILAETAAINVRQTLLQQQDQILADARKTVDELGASFFEAGVSADDLTEAIGEIEAGRTFDSVVSRIADSVAGAGASFAELKTAEEEVRRVLALLGPDFIRLNTAVISSVTDTAKLASNEKRLAELGIDLNSVIQTTAGNLGPGEGLAGKASAAAGSVTALRKRVGELQKELDDNFTPGTQGAIDKQKELTAATLALEAAMSRQRNAVADDLIGPLKEIETLKPDSLLGGFVDGFREIGTEAGESLADGIEDGVDPDRIKDSIFSSIQAINDALFDLQAAQLERETEAQLEAIEIRRQRELQIADETGQGKEAINERFDKITQAVEKKAAQRRKEIALAEALINTALGVTRALASLDPPFSFIQAATIGILGGIQIAKIQSTTFAKGGFTGKKRLGRDHTGQHIAGTVHDDEFVFNRGITKQHRQEFERVHRGESPYAVFGGAVRADLNDRRIVRHLGRIGGKIDQQTQYLKNLHGDTRGRFFHSRSSGRI